MGRRPRTTTDDLVERLTRAFRTRGFEQTSIGDLAADAGVNRASLYHRFPGGKEEMAEACLAGTLRVFAAEIDAREAEPPRLRLETFLNQIDAYFGSGELACLMGNLALSDPPARLRKALHHAFDRWREALRRPLAEGGVDPARAQRLAEDAIVRTEGALILGRALGDGSIVRDQLGRIRADLLASLESRIET